MLVLALNMKGDGAWPDLVQKAKDNKLMVLQGTMHVATLDKGMDSGLPSITFRFELPDGTTVLAETSVRLFQAVAAAIRGKYGEV